jgi:hypothetical protein
MPETLSGSQLNGLIARVDEYLDGATIASFGA